MNTPKTIELFLVEGEARGIRTAAVGNRTGKAVVIPRSRIKEAAERSELEQVGIYFLFGEDEEVNRPIVYVGEAESVIGRLRQHHQDSSKDYWDTAVAFVAKDNSLTKAHVKYLENISYQAIIDANRSTVKNNSNPATAHLPETTEATAREFYEDLKLLISTLGYPVFVPAAEQSADYTTYYCKGRGVEATGRYTDDGFLVMAGSGVNLDVTDSASDWISSLGQKLLKNDILEQKGGDKAIFTEDYLLRSPSGAAAIVLGRNTNGWTRWKDAQGNTLHDNERA